MDELYTAAPALKEIAVASPPQSSPSLWGSATLVKCSTVCCVRLALISSQVASRRPNHATHDMGHPGQELLYEYL